MVRDSPVFVMVVMIVMVPMVVVMMKVLRWDHHRRTHHWSRIRSGRDVGRLHWRAICHRRRHVHRLLHRVTWHDGRRDKHRCGFAMMMMVLTTEKRVIYHMPESMFVMIVVHSLAHHHRGARRHVPRLPVIRLKRNVIVGAFVMWRTLYAPHACGAPRKRRSARTRLT